MKTEIRINGVKYCTQSEDTGCIGCAFQDDDGPCHEIFDDETYNQCRDIIWVKAEQPTSDDEKYTLAEFTNALEAWIAASDHSNRDEYIAKYLKNNADPEYKEFLRLREKFK